jgi:mannose-6-phosphate isomerase-like protein (cupin superfamily)
VVETDKPVTLAFVHNKSKVREEGSRDRVLLGGTTFMGIKPDEETPFLLPLEYSAKAYVFAHEDAFVEIDSVPMNIEADTYFLITSPGHHRIRSSGNLVIQVIYWSFTTRYFTTSRFGAAIPCIQAANVTPDVTLAPIAEESSLMPYVYVGFGVAAAAVVAVIGFLAIKRRSK